MRGTLEEALLVQYQVDPTRLAWSPPPGLELDVRRDVGILSVLIGSLQGVGPSWWPARLGLSAHLALYRLVVRRHDEHGVTRAAYPVLGLVDRRLLAWLGRWAPFPLAGAAIELSTDAEGGTRVQVRRGATSLLHGVFHPEESLALPAASILVSPAEARALLRTGTVRFLAESAEPLASRLRAARPVVVDGELPRELVPDGGALDSVFSVGRVEWVLGRVRRGHEALAAGGCPVPGA